MRIYIAGPYTADSEQVIERNVQTAIDAGIALVLRGHAPFIPHLTHFVDQRCREIGIAIHWDTYLTWDLEWLELCDAVLCLGNSRGSDIEVAAAQKWGKRIYRSLDEIEPAA